MLYGHHRCRKTPSPPTLIAAAELTSPQIAQGCAPFLSPWGVRAGESRSDRLYVYCLHR